MNNLKVIGVINFVLLEFDIEGIIFDVSWLVFVSFWKLLSSIEVISWGLFIN